jgi:hypothetical protein
MRALLQDAVARGKNACEECGATENIARSEELGLLCGACFEAVAAHARLGRLLDETEAFVARYVILPGDAERTAVALWIVHTHGIDGAHATPYLLILSPEKRSGKTRVQEVLELLVARPWRVIGASEAALFRKLAQRPTLLLDEIDAIFGSHPERTEPLRAVLNAGNRPGSTVPRCVGEKSEVKDFEVFSAKALAGIDSGHRIPDTIRDRAIPIAMRRKTSSEQVARFRHRNANAEAAPLRDRLATWGEGATNPLLGAEPDSPPELDDRAAEAWEPLFAIADAAGDRWPQRAREAALVLSTGGDPDEQSLGVLVLTAARTALRDRDRITSAGLVEFINSDEESPFGGFRDGRGLDTRGLAKLLRPYGIRPRTIRVGDNPNHRGYLREQFVDAWERWIPRFPIQGPQAPQTPQATEPVTDIPLEQGNVADVAGIPGRGKGVADVRATPAGNGAAPGGEADLFGDYCKCAAEGNPPDFIRDYTRHESRGAWRCRRCELEPAA